MAGPLLHTTSGAGNLSSMLGLLYGQVISDNIMRACVLPQLVPVRFADPGTQTITWVANFSDSSYTNGAIADGGTISVYNSDVKTPATLQFTTYQEAVAVGGRAQAVAANVNNPTALGNLLGREIADASRRLAKKIATDIYTGTGASYQLQGLYSTTGSTYGGLVATGTYAGISRSTYSEWASNVLSNSGTARALSFDLMRQMRRTIYTACGLKPNLIITDPVTHEYYGKLFGNERRYVSEVRLNGQKITLDGGYQVLEFDGIPVVEDVNHPAGKMSFLNTDYVEIVQMPFVQNGYDNSMAGQVTLAGTAEEYLGQGSTKIQAKIERLAKSGDVTNLGLFAYLQMVVRQPNTCGHIADLLTT